ncbi:uncharacterized protein LOC104883928 [Beta vulgaris subsp. vulgaris]|uniref:uncharacterized protein LOC104883928 n=1 Tax=Beta vulgaris subsp. vulgaris TaxID=3555 RepID=UPI0020375417|nr:uncharacterized protein LOC104883928 [Beta vulgaris subsp. vulgaris]
MRKGAFVLIFLVWAFITIITPTLVQWSIVAAQPHPQVTTHDSIHEKPNNDEGIVKHRRMLVLIDGMNTRKVPTAEPALPPNSTVPQPAPSLEHPSNHEAER